LIQVKILALARVIKLGEKTVDELLDKWYLRIKRYQFAHRFASKGLSKLYLILGVLSVLFATMTGTAIFASLEKDLPGYGKILTGLLSLLAALLSALQTFLQLDERSEMHQRADANYSSIRQKIEQHQAIRFRESVEQESLQEFLDIIRQEMDVLARDSPLVPERYWHKARIVLASQLKSS
jgi:hypothetical protein